MDVSSASHLFDDDSYSHQCLNQNVRMHSNLILDFFLQDKENAIQDWSQAFY